MFGRATIRLGIGPHSSFVLFWLLGCLKTLNNVSKRRSSSYFDHLLVLLHFLANVNVRHLLSPVRLSLCRLSVCNARAPYSGGCKFWQFFYGVWYLGHPLTCTEKFMQIVPGNLSVSGVKPKRGSKI